MTEPARCAVCKQQAYRDKNGRMMMHTRTEYESGRPPIAVVCEGSDRGARP